MPSSPRQENPCGSRQVAGVLGRDVHARNPGQANVQQSERCLNGRGASGNPGAHERRRLRRSTAAAATRRAVGGNPSSRAACAQAAQLPSEPTGFRCNLPETPAAPSGRHGLIPTCNGDFDGNDAMGSPCGNGSDVGDFGRSRFGAGGRAEVLDLHGAPVERLAGHARRLDEEGRSGFEGPDQVRTLSGNAARRHARAALRPGQGRRRRRHLDAARHHRRPLPPGRGIRAAVHDDQRRSDLEGVLGVRPDLRQG